jgi:hypothetical protein
MLMLTMLYGLSIGPEHWLMYRDVISPDVHRMLMDTVYRPLILAADVSYTVDYAVNVYVMQFYP